MKGMKFNIDDRIVDNYDLIDQTFMGISTMHKLGFKDSEKPLFYENLERMEALGILARNSARMYIKLYLSNEKEHGLTIWFREYLKSRPRPTKKQKEPPLISSDLASKSIDA